MAGDLPLLNKTLTEPAGGSPSPAPSGSGRGFPPGTVFAERYRIVSPLGRGGMGTVYRAEDLRLGHTVALKFLSPELSRDEGMLHYLTAEVRNARQVSHPNVCRVYDIGEHAGQHFLSMEYVDGEDLASLLHRIGRLPAAKALEISREICAGLSAAHDQGVIHRDLKPANIMIDGRGQARIMDFGLAVKPAERSAGHDGAGTPAYMAPEQLAGLGTSVKSDIYSLGLVLYELFTGRRALEGATPEEIRRKQLSETLRPASSFAADIDPEIDRVIMSCLARDPASRPRSVLEVAAALPGGDPLKAALAAGRTPSPEMVAAAGKEGSLGTWAAWGLMGAFMALLGLAVVLAPRSVLLGTPGYQKSPEVLAERAREIIGSAGYKDEPKDSAFWFEADEDLIRWIQKKEPGDLGSRLVRFRYRQSPERLIPRGDQGYIREDNPPFDTAGMSGVDLDSRGRLLHFLAIPGPGPAPGETGLAPDWTAFMNSAGLDVKGLSPAASNELPPIAFDRREAWTGTLSQPGAVPIRVAAASLGGRPMYFEVKGPWNDRAVTTSGWETWTQRIFPVLWFGILLVLLVFGSYLARRNARMKRSDPRGSFRIAAIAFAALAASSVLWAHHSYDSFGDFMWWVRSGLAFFLFDGAFIWISYMAMEPAMRRNWAKLLISWSRLMSGRFRDPLVGRDILIGSIFGVISALPVFIFEGFPTWMFLPGEWAAHIELNSLLGLPQQIGTVFYLLGLTAFYGVGWMVAMVFCRAVFKKTWLIAIVFSFFGTTTLLVGTSGDFSSQILSGLVFGTIINLILLFSGFFPAAVSFFVYNLLVRMPLRLDLAGSAGRGSTLTLILVIGLVFYGFWTSLGGRSIFGRLGPED
jgi:hypothetical protein